MSVYLRAAMLGLLLTTVWAVLDRLTFNSLESAHYYIAVAITCAAGYIWGDRDGRRH